ncbi:MAG TPA: hypothetical protein VMT20_07600 [Terriglobia bacterium]|nr:hypothetical protein [Terriglobia bacterium]
MFRSSELSNPNRTRRNVLLLFYAAALTCGISAGIASVRLTPGSDRLGLVPLGIATMAGLVAITALIGVFRTADELQRRINHQALAFAHIGTLILCFLAGIFQPEDHLCISGLGICVLLVALWSLGLILFSRRYQ